MKQTQTKTNSATIQGIIIAAVCIALGIIANAAGIDYEAETTKEVITVAVTSISTSVVALIGLYRAWKGRLNPDIKPIDTKKE